MTRQEFIDNTTTFWELIDFCNDYNCYVCEDVVDDEYRDELIDEEVSSIVEDEHWYTIRDLLDNIPTGYSYYRANGGLDFDGLDTEDFNYYFEEVLDWADSNGVFDDEDEDEEEYDEPVDDVVVHEPDVQIGDLISMCWSDLDRIKAADAEQELAGAQDVSEFFAECIGA